MAAASSLRSAVFPLLRHRIAMARGARRMSTTGTGTGAGNTGGGSGQATGGAANSGGRGAGGGVVGNSGGGGARRMSTTGTGTGAGNTGGGSGQATGGAANSGGRGAGGGVVGNSGGGGAGNSGGSGGATGLEELRRDALKETGRLLDGYSKLSDADTKLLDEIARLEMENLQKGVRAKENLFSTTYVMLSSGAVVFLTISAWLSQYIKGCVVHDAAKEVVEMQRLRKLDALIDAQGEGGAAAASANVVDTN